MTPDFAELRPLIERYDPAIPIERASLPPADWYTDARMLPLDKEAVLCRNWLAAAPVDLLAEQGAFVTGDVLGMRYLLVREKAEIKGFWNVCRHHAAQLLDGRGTVSEVRCPYHGWCYRTDGALKSAPRIGGIEDFRREDFGLVPIPTCTWGRYVFVYLGDGPPPPTPSEELLAKTDATGWRELRFDHRREFFVDCDWKVFVDNYLDGGYHIPTAHPGLDGELDPAAYRTELFDRFSLQTSTGKTDGAPTDSRIGGDAFYAWLYPTFCINRYGEMLDVNIIEPVGPRRIRVVFDYFFADGAFSDGEGGVDEAKKADALRQSEQIQDEDAWLCERVQAGKASQGYDRGRYVPRVEMAEQHFHRLLCRDYLAAFG